MLSAIFAAAATSTRKEIFPILDLPVELVERVVGCLGPEDQKAMKAARASCTQLRSAINFGVSKVKIASEMEGKTLPQSLLPSLKAVYLDVSNGRNLAGLWTPENLCLLGLDGAPKDCEIHIQADAAILHLSKIAAILEESGLMPRVRSFSQQSWGTHGPPAKLGHEVEVKAKLKLVRQECMSALIFNTLQHDNLTSLCFAPMLKAAWTRDLVERINHSAHHTLKSLIINFRPFQEVTLEPLAYMNLPLLEHLELRVQNVAGFGIQQLEPLAKACVPRLKSLSVELTGDSVVPHLGEFLRPLVSCTELECIDIWANRIESFAGLWGVGLGGIHLPKLHSLSLRGSPCSIHTSRSVFAANPHDPVVDAFAGLNLDKLALQDIGLPEGAAAKGIARLVLTNPRWDDLRIAMSPAFSPDLKVIRVCGTGACAIRSKVLENMIETPTMESGWRMGSPSNQSGMHKIRSFVVLHDGLIHEAKQA